MEDEHVTPPMTPNDGGAAPFAADQPLTSGAQEERISDPDPEEPRAAVDQAQKVQHSGTKGEQSESELTQKTTGTSGNGHGSDSRSGILVKDDIMRERLIRFDPTDHDERCYKHASYDLRLGSEYIFPHIGDHDKQLQILNCENNGMLTIPAFGSALVSTFESVALPSNVSGRFDLRIRHAFEGLMVQMGTQVEPGYEGPLFALLHNISEQAKTLKFKDYDTRPFTIEFSYTTQPTAPPPNRKRTIRDFVPPNYAKGGPDRVIEDIHKVQTDLRDISKDFSLKKMTIFTGISLLLLITTISVMVPFFLTKLTYDKDYFPIVSADAIAAMKYGPNRSSEAEIVERVIQTLESRNPAIFGRPSPSQKSATPRSSASLLDRELVERLLRLRVTREALRNDPSRAEELRAINSEITIIIDLLNK